MRVNALNECRPDASLLSLGSGARTISFSAAAREVSHVLRSSLCLMVSMVRDGAVSPTELVQAHLRQIEARNPELNAFVSVFAESALEEARASESAIMRGEPLGPLHGVPVTVKDSFDIAEQPTLAGS